MCPPVSAAIAQFANELESKELYKTSLELGDPQWDVLETRSASQIVDEFLDRLRQTQGPPSRSAARAAAPRARKARG